MISSLMIINLRGEVLVYREYSDFVKRLEFNEFSTYLLSTKGLKENPIIYFNGVSYFYIKQKDLFIIVSTKANPNAGMIFEFLFQFLNICKAYFAQELNDATVRKNFVIIYELLDEILDYGVPQITQPEVLKKYILEGGLKLEQMSDFEKLKQITMQATGANSWRPEGIVYRKNNIYIDLIETVNLTFSNQGKVLKFDIYGAIECKSELSGMPECKFGMNDKLLLQRDFAGNGPVNRNAVVINDLKFDQCVKLSKFDKERAITFIPPDGKFTLMNYRISDCTSVPIKLMCLFSKDDNKMEYKIKLKTEFESTNTAENIELKIPIPEGVTKVKMNPGVGKAKHEVDQSAVMWRIKKFQGGKEALLRVDVDLPKDFNANSWIKAPISLNFNIPMFTVSGVKVNFIKILEKSGYKPYKWIRYLTKSGEYHLRV